VALQFDPARLGRSMETSRLSRAISSSGMRAINPTFRVSGLFLKSCQEECGPSKRLVKYYLWYYHVKPFLRYALNYTS
jgi:hypothetical protein